MLTLFIAHIIITAGCLWGGYLLYTFISCIKESRPLIFYIIGGLISLTLLVQIVALFFPVSTIIKLTIAVLIILSAIIKRRDCKNLINRIHTELAQLSLFSLLMLSILWLIILLISAGPILMDDTDSYHIQMIKWIQEYGSVPGLVNLHERFGFNSSWFSSVAIFSFSPASTGGFTVINSVLSVWFVYWCISKLNQFQKEKNLQAGLGILLSFICCITVWPMIRGNAATANYDFITTCLVFILFTETLFSEENNYYTRMEWIIWPAYLFTIRIINFPLLLLSVIALIVFLKQKKNKPLILSLAYCLLLVAPFLIRNIVLSGYLFYPATYCDWFSTDWKADPQMKERLLEYIKYYNRVPTTFLDIEQTKALGANWISTWFQYLFFYDKILIIIGLAGIVWFYLRLFVSKNIFSRNIAVFMTIILIWLVCWFIISPDPRFVYGGLLAGMLVFVHQIFSLLKNYQFLKTMHNTIGVILVLASIFYFILKPIKQREYRNWISPATLPQPPVKEIMIDGITFRIPDPINNNWNARCFGTDLPCLYKIEPRLKARGKNINDGFHLEK